MPIRFVSKLSYTVILYSDVDQKSNFYVLIVQFFQIDDNPQKDLYQIGLFIALIYLLVQYLRATL